MSFKLSLVFFQIISITKPHLYVSISQMVTYEAAKEGVSSGWFFWTLKMEGGAFAEWDFLRGLREGWIHTLPAPEKASEDIYGACYDIIFETNDSMSIVHEFPDPKSLDPTNWYVSIVLLEQ